MQQRAGFSLVEVLSVLAVLTILAAIVLPVIMHARQRQPAISCMVNLQQIQHAMLLYTTDYDGTYPPVATSQINANDINRDTWNTLILPYYGKPHIERCPNIDQAIGAVETTQPHLILGYALNRRLNNDMILDRKYYTQGRREVCIRYPALTVSVAESRLGITGLDAPDTSTENSEQLGMYATEYLSVVLKQQPAAIRHNGGANYTFTDGHVKWLQPMNLNTDNQSDGIRPGFGL